MTITALKIHVFMFFVLLVSNDLSAQQSDTGNSAVRDDTLLSHNNVELIASNGVKADSLENIDEDEEQGFFDILLPKLFFVVLVGIVFGFVSFLINK